MFKPQREQSSTLHHMTLKPITLLYTQSEMTSSTTPSTMTAAVYVPGDSQLTIAKDYPTPKPAADEVLLKIKACGVCHSDVRSPSRRLFSLRFHILHSSEFQVFFLTESLQDPRKYIMGHEASGEVVALGAAVSPMEVKVGKLYAVYVTVPCVTCMRPPPATEPSLTGFGVGQNGGYAEYAVAKASQLVPVVSVHKLSWRKGSSFDCAT
jgi:propanol-preferring alcohol dehydrogenase